MDSPHPSAYAPSPNHHISHDLFQVGHSRIDYSLFYFLLQIWSYFLLIKHPTVGGPHYRYSQQVVNSNPQVIHANVAEVITNYVNTEPRFPNPCFSNDGSWWEANKSRYGITDETVIPLSKRRLVNQTPQSCLPGHSRALNNALEQPNGNSYKCKCPHCCYHRTGGRFHLQYVRSSPILVF